MHDPSALCFRADPKDLRETVATNAEPLAWSLTATKQVPFGDEAVFFTESARRAWFSISHFQLRLRVGGPSHA